VYVQKWHLRYKASDISEIKQPEPKLLQSVYRNSYTAYRLVTNLLTYGKLWPTFPGAKFFHKGYLAHFCRSATKFGRIRGLANRNLFPEFRELWSGGPV